MRKLYGLILIMTFLSACSQQYRTTDPGLSPEEVYAEIDRISSSIQSSSADLNIFEQILQDSTKTIYYAESGGSMGPVASVFSFHNLDWFGIPGGDVFYSGIQQAKIIFIDGFASDGNRYFALLVETQGGQNVAPFLSISEPNDYAITDDEFVTRMPDANGGEIVLRSFDVDDEVADELGANIKLTVWDTVNGEEGLVGQFSILAGFGGL